MDATQVPELFEIVHLKVFVPKANPVTPEVGEVGVVTVAPPAITVHTPAPTVGVFPASVAVVNAQRDWSGPAAEVVGLTQISAPTAKKVAGVFIVL